MSGSILRPLPDVLFCGVGVVDCGGAFFTLTDTSEFANNSIKSFFMPRTLGKLYPWSATPGNPMTPLSLLLPSPFSFFDSLGRFCNFGKRFLELALIFSCICCCKSCCVGIRANFGIKAVVVGVVLMVSELVQLLLLFALVLLEDDDETLPGNGVDESTLFGSYLNSIGSSNSSMSNWGSIYVESIVPWSSESIWLLSPG